MLVARGHPNGRTAVIGRAGHGHGSGVRASHGRSAATRFARPNRRNWAYDIESARDYRPRGLSMPSVGDRSCRVNTAL